MNIKTNYIDEYSGNDSPFEQSNFNDQINDESLSETVDEIENGLIAEKIVNRLTTLVRKQYYTYLEKLLKENFESWCKKSDQQFEIEGICSSPGEWIKKSATLYEQKALKSCMITQFYRKSMLKIIANIRRETVHGKLAEKLKDLKESENDIKDKNITVKTEKSILIDASTQTDLNDNNKIEKEDDLSTEKKDDLSKAHNEINPPTEYLSLDERIISFQKQLEEQEKLLKETDIKMSRKKKYSYSRKRKQYLPYEKNRKYSNINNNEDSLTPPQPIFSPIEELQQQSSCDSPLENEKINKEKQEESRNKSILEEDEVAKEMEILFGKEHHNDIDDIFGEGNFDPQIDQILKEIEGAKLPVVIASNSTTAGIVTDAGTTEDMNGECLDSVVNEDKHFGNEYCEIASQQQKANTDSILHDSIWPCELHMRKQKLRETLENVADRGIRCHEIIKATFLELFGEDSDDEFAVYSPTLELNEILLASCKKRIAPWIVKHLMVPLKKGLIGNRFLFKKFAKKLASFIVIQNQYPDENYIKKTVEDFFCRRRTIMSIEDIELV